MEENDRSTITELFNLMEQIPRNPMVLKDKNFKRAVLFLGITGAGKSSLFHMLFTDNRKLRSKETYPGSREFIITDEDNKIGHGNLSHTLWPEGKIDSSNEFINFDCNGFGDTRNPNHDMVGSYMTKKIIVAARQAKFVLVVNHTSLKKSIDRDDFIKLLRHATEFISEIDKFKDSIVLVVSKVDNETSFEDTGVVLLSDEILKRNVARYIKDVRDNITNNPEFYFENDFYIKGVCLLNIILKEVEKEFVNIVLFRRPLKCGSFTEIPKINEVKTKIQYAIDELSFADIQSDYFSFTISDRSKKWLYKMLASINDFMEKIVLNLNDYFINSLTGQLKQFQNEYDFNSEIDKLHLYLKNMIDKLEKSNDMKTFMRNFLRLLLKFKIENLKYTVVKIKDYHLYIQFLIEISNGQDLKLLFLHWTRPLKIVLTFIQQKLNWSNFIIAIHKNLSTYEMFEQRQQIKDLGEITQSNFDTFTNLFKNIKQNDLEKSADNLKNLNQLLKVCLEPPTVDFDAETGVLKIRAEFFSTGGLNHHAGQHSRAKKIHVSVYNTVFIDEDFIRIGSNLTVTIIAPTWQIIGTRRIALDGIDGTKFNPLKADPGIDGLPGNAGGTGGFFTGIVQYVVSRGHLKITANGGQGGKGQDGGDGIPGTDGQLEALNTEDANLSQRTLISSSENRKVTFRNVWAYPIGRTYWINKNDFLITAAGKNGQDGAPGGAGGIGGGNGDVNILGLTAYQLNKNFSLCSSCGKDGKPGDGGKGGEPGKNVAVIRAANEKGEVYWFGNKKASEFLGWLGSNSVENVETYARRGKDCGQTGGPIGGPSMTNKSEVDLTQLICEYKLYILNNLKCKHRAKQLKQFYELLNNDKQIKHVYGPEGFLKELYYLELYSCSFGDNNDILDLYKSLLERTETYMSQMKDVSHKLKYIQAVTFSKIVTMESKPNNNLIIDIHKYFKMIKIDFTQMETAQKQKMIKKYYTECKESFIKNITEATLFLNGIILKIEADVNNMHRHIQYIENDLSQLSALSTNMTDKLHNDQRKLEELARERDMCSFLNFIKNIFTNIFQIVININNFVRENRHMVRNFFNVVQNLFPDKRVETLILYVDTGLNFIRIVVDDYEIFFNDQDIFKNTHNVTQDYVTCSAFINEQQKKLQRHLEQCRRSEASYLSFRECFMCICEILLPFYYQLYNSLKELQENNDDAQINVAKWNMQSALKNIRSLVIKVKLDGDSQYLINVFEDGIDSMISILDQIQVYCDQHKMMKYITDLSSTNNSMHEEIPTDLDLMIKCNITYSRYKNIVSSLKQHVFPFATYYLKEFKVPYYNLQDRNVSTWVTNITTQLQILQSKIIEKNCVLQHSIDQYIHETKFGDTIAPFYLWGSNKYEPSISQLLSGHKVTLTADITDNTHSDRYAIKFRVAHIKLIHPDFNMNSVLQSYLKFFDVSLTHHGNSHYLYENNYYKIMSDSLTFECSYQFKAGTPESFNEVFKKVKAGHFMLSPYATWSLQLICKSDKIDFTHLEPYKEKVDLLLVGHGQYISENKTLSAQDVQKYYQPMETMFTDIIQTTI